MTTDIEFRDGDAQFSFRTNGTHFMVRTETAPDSFARVIVEEVAGPPVPLEPSTEDE